MVTRGDGAYALFGLLTLAGAATLGATPVLADAITYAGTLGKAAIVLELSQPVETAGSRVVGRYFYRAKGIDIPLDAGASHPGHVQLAEELPCPDDSDQTCPFDPGQNPVVPIRTGPIWTLSSSADGTALTGTWTDKGRSLPLVLSRVGSRPLDTNFADNLADYWDGLGPLTKETEPYEFERMQVKLNASAVTRWGDSAFHYVVDPRTRFRFPRIDKAGATDVTAANAALQLMHWENNMAAFRCAAMVYPSLRDNDVDFDATNDLGGWPDENIEVTYLSPTLMSWHESGSTFCGGAHPDNHDIATTIDVRTGKPADLSLIFSGWVPTLIDSSSPTDLASARAKPDAYIWGPDQTLANFVFAHLPPDEQSTADDGACGNLNDIQQSLSISFVTGELVRFGLTDLPAVSSDCNGRLVDLPLADLKPLLAQTASQYFPSLTAK